MAMEDLVEYMKTLPEVIRTATIDTTKQGVEPDPNRYKSAQQIRDEKQELARKNLLEVDIVKKKLRIQGLHQEMAKMDLLCRNQQEECDTVNGELVTLKTELSATRSRLGAIVSRKTSGKSGSQCRAFSRTLVLDMFHEEWTEARTLLTEVGELPEKQACELLVKTLLKTYEICKRLAEDDLDQLYGVLMKAYKYRDWDGKMGALIEARHGQGQLRTANIRKELDDPTAELFTGKEDRSAMESYFIKCADVCWLMAMQDPPVYPDTNLYKDDEEFNRDTHHPYFNTGKYMDYVVWPATLCTGKIFTKGMARGKDIDGGSAALVGSIMQRAGPAAAKTTPLATRLTQGATKQKLTPVRATPFSNDAQCGVDKMLESIRMSAGKPKIP